MTAPRSKPGMAAVSLRKNGELYTVFFGDDLIGRVQREASKSWKAVDGYMEWTRRYVTRAHAVRGLLRHWKAARP